MMRYKHILGLTKIMSLRLKLILFPGKQFFLKLFRSFIISIIQNKRHRSFYINYNFSTHNKTSVFILFRRQPDDDF